MGRIKFKSFTLVEMIVAVGIIALILPSIFNIFFIMIRQQIVLISYRDMIKQGSSIEKNIKYILQNRAVEITESTYTTDVCSVLTTPTPQFSHIYIKDREGKPIEIYQDGLNANKIASVAAEPNKKYFLNTSTVQISNLSFTCYRVNDFTPPYVSASYTISKSALFKDVSLPYSFSVKLRSY